MLVNKFPEVREKEFATTLSRWFSEQKIGMEEKKKGWRRKTYLQLNILSSFK